ncbi:hypothetical protein BD560DRAFT_443276 [Blakeslea trispora]|nr:hypothetical protein BD560DRAFT_443276 [Blakeslea trispora]
MADLDALRSFPLEVFEVLLTVLVFVLKSITRQSNKSSELELEEGETVSPSPSPSCSPSIEKTKTIPSNHSDSRKRKQEKHSKKSHRNRKSSPYPESNSSRSRSRSRSRGRSRGLSRSRSHSRGRDHGRDRARTHARARSRTRSRSRSRAENPARRRESKRSHHRSRSPKRPRHSRSRSTSLSPSIRRTEKRNRRRSSDQYSIENSQSSSKRRQDSSDRAKTKKTASEPHKKLPPAEEKLGAVAVLSAIASNADTPEQCRLFNTKFSQLAHASKRRGDNQSDMTMSILDHFYALCDYILSFYYADKNSTQLSFRQTSQAWRSLFPFTDNLLKKLEQQKHLVLYGLCARLVSLVRYYIFSRLSLPTQIRLKTYLSQEQGSEDRSCLESSASIFREFERGERWYRMSEQHFTYASMIADFPQTFQHVCLDGDVLAGISVGGEAGVSLEPMFPFAPYSPLHHAAIVSKCMLREFIQQKKLDYQPIVKPEECV